MNHLSYEVPYDRIQKEASNQASEDRPAGPIAASVWRRQSPSGFEYFDFSLSRSWKTQSTGREGYSSNFFAANAEELLEVIVETAAWIAQQQSALDAATDANRDTSQAA